MIKITFRALFFLSLIQLAPATLADFDILTFDDSTLKEDLQLPDWFKLSFLDIADNLEEARADGKQGIIIYFGRKDCAYCKAQLETNWGSRDIIEYTQKYFDVIAIDVRGQREVTDLDGSSYSEKQYAISQKTNFTPTLLFINLKGEQVLKLPGFRPPYQFRAALEYVADQHYIREPFGHYLSRAEQALSYGQEELNENDLFMLPPYTLDRSHISSKRPLLVFFEYPKCHACDVLHAGPMTQKLISDTMKQLDVVQLDTSRDTPVITPGGKKTTARAWAHELELNFAPTLIFFDEHGQEIIRVDSVIRFYRLHNVLNYVITKGYTQYPTFQLWRENYKSND
ncbi:MAG: thioredoxin fold domain-containing protein [Gammaproteobacteria bacterium]|nr:thioredoxin fold domain-containing protein [Gammaproteobacteria bacterium]